jgi:hypothetical protein
MVGAVVDAVEPVVVVSAKTLALVGLALLPLPEPVLPEAHSVSFLEVV